MIWLDGFDYAAAFLDRECRAAPGGGNPFVIELEGEDFFQEAEVRRLLDSVPEEALRVMNGSMKRHPLHAAPYWEPGEAKGIVLTKALSAESFANEPILSSGGHGCVCAMGGRSLYFKFDHRIFDGKGAEGFLDALARGDADSLRRTGSGMDSPKLKEWGIQFSSGRKIQHRLTAMARSEGGIAGFSVPSTAPALFRSIRLSPDQAGELRAESERIAGPFMLLPYLLSLTAGRLAPFAPDGNFEVQMSVDRRTAGGEDQGFFFNRWSLLPLFAEREELADPECALTAFRRAILKETEEKTAEAFRYASRLSRIAPYRLLHALGEKFGSAVTGTLMFSYLPGGFRGESFAGTRIGNLVHYPAMPIRPGFGVVFNAFGDGLNAVVSIREGALSGEDLEKYLLELEAALK